MRGASRVAVSVGFLSVAACAPAWSHGEDHTQLEAHEHGRGVLNIAIEGARVDVALDVAAADIVGFEHKAATSEQKSLIARAKVLLRDPLKVFGPVGAAGCETVSSDVHFTAEHHGKHEHGDDDQGAHKHDDHDHEKGGHDDHAKGGNDHEGRAHDDGDDHGLADGHGEVHAAYTLKCASAAKLTAFQLTYFELFPSAESLQVNIVSEASQVRKNASPGKAEISVGGGA